MHVAVIGAGAAGLTAAYQLAKVGIEVELFEATDAVGGHLRSFPLWNQTVDLGPQCFHGSDERVNRLWREILGTDFQWFNRQTRIHSGGRLLDYPVSAAGLLKHLGLIEATHCLVDYYKQRASKQNHLDRTGTTNFETSCVSRFGRRLFEKFFRHANEKQWGLACQHLDAELGMQHIPGLPFDEPLQQVLGMSRKQRGSARGRFAYPNAGAGLPYDRMAEFIRGLGGEIHLNRPIRRVMQQNGQVRGLVTASGELLRFDRVISTMPLTQLAKGLDDVPFAVQRAADSLTYRNAFLVYLRVAGRDLFADPWLNIHSPELLVGRVTNFCNWSPQTCGSSPDTILALEYWCGDHEELWKQQDEDLIRRGTAELVTSGLLQGRKINGGHVVRLRRRFPVYARGFQRHRQVILQHLATIAGLEIAGRVGSFQHNDQDQSLLMGLVAAERILEQNGTRGISNAKCDSNAIAEPRQQASPISAAK